MRQNRHPEITCNSDRHSRSAANEPARRLRRPRRKLSVGANLCVTAAIAVAASLVNDPIAGAATPAVTVQGTVPVGALNVIAYGADPTGSRDSAAAIAGAIATAQQTAGTTVYFPAGKYVLDNNNGALSAFLIDKNPVHIMGAGAGSTRLVQLVGVKSGLAQGQAIFQISSGRHGQAGGGDGTVIEGLTLDSASYDGGTTILDYGNGTTIRDDEILGPVSNHGYNRDQFGVRVIAVCDHTDFASRHRSNNTIENVTITGQGSAGNTDLDLSCQQNATVTNLTDTGNGMDLYIDRGVLVNDMVFHPGTLETSPQPFIVTPPSNALTLDDVTSYGSGGKIQPSPNGYTTSNVTIDHEQMLGDSSNSLTLGDVTTLTISKSSISAIVINPSHAAAGITVQSSTVGSTQCVNPKLITNLVGAHC